MTPEDRNNLIKLIHNLYISTYGAQPSHINFSSMSVIELDQMADMISEDATALELISDEFE